MSRPSIAVWLVAGELYPGTYEDVQSHTYQLRSFTVQHGDSFGAFVQGSSGDWKMVRGSKESSVGTWEQLCEACVKGRLLPHLLIFERPEIVSDDE